MFDEALDRFEAHLLATGAIPLGSDGPSRFVGLDGRSGAGKSTLAAALARRLEGSRGTTVTVVEGDQFYAGGSSATWDRRGPVENAERVIDWRRERAVLEALRSTGAAAWHPFDWEAPDWDGDRPPLLDDEVRAVAGDVILLEGAYSCRPELHDVLDVLVLLAPPEEVRRAQLLAREGDTYRTEWEERWGAAEDHYFGAVMPPERFDLVIRPGSRPR